MAGGGAPPNTFSGVPKLGAAPKAGELPNEGGDPKAAAAGGPPNTGGLPKPEGFWKLADDPKPVCATGLPVGPLKAPVGGAPNDELAPKAVVWPKAGLAPNVEAPKAVEPPKLPPEK